MSSPHMSELKRIYQARGPGDAHFLRGLLESEGIAVVIRGDDFVPFQGGNLFDLETRPSLWVLGDETLPRAVEIVTDYVRRVELAPQRSGPAWTCRWCAEEVEAQFTDCWKCGKQRP